jgi:hypothetical protein
MSNPEGGGGAPRTLKALWYRLAFVLAAAGLVLTAISTNGAALTDLAPGRQAAEPDARIWITNLTSIALLLPLGILAFHLGAQSQSARRLDLVLWKGIASAWRLAWTGRGPSSLAADYARPVRDDVRAAWLRGLFWGAFPIAFFLGVAPPLRTPGGVVWIVGAGVLFGIIGYCRRRAAAYLRDVPRLFDPFREWKLLSSRRYEPEGHPFVRAQQVCSILLPLWWLGVGPLVLF